jgi:hypothetical protein
MNSDEDILASEAISSDSYPADYEVFAGEILVANGEPLRWFTLLPYAAIVAALAYYFHIRPLDPVNTVFATLFFLWLVYTPIAKKQGWFYFSM